MPYFVEQQGRLGEGSFSKPPTLNLVDTPVKHEYSTNIEDASIIAY
jgi:hypothetical protein